MPQEGTITDIRFTIPDQDTAQHENPYRTVHVVVTKHQEAAGEHDKAMKHVASSFILVLGIALILILFLSKIKPSHKTNRLLDFLERITG